MEEEDEEPEPPEPFEWTEDWTSHPLEQKHLADTEIWNTRKWESSWIES